MKEKERPLKKIRFGAICASIWRDTHTDSKGHSFDTESVLLDRTYKDKNGEWKHTGSLRKDDCLKGALVLQKAFEFLATPEEDENAEERVEVEEERVR